MESVNTGTPVQQNMGVIEAMADQWGFCDVYTQEVLTIPLNVPKTTV